MAGILAAFCGGMLTALNKSKCSDMNCCCGLLHCVRDVEAEARIEEHRIDMHIPDTPTMGVGAVASLAPTGTRI